MKKLASLLFLMLVLTNGFWLYTMMDLNPISRSQKAEALHDALAWMPVIAGKGSSAQSIILSNQKEKVMKGRYYQVGQLHFKFNESGELLRVKLAWAQN